MEVPQPSRVNKNKLIKKIFFMKKPLYNSRKKLYHIESNNIPSLDGCIGIAGNMLLRECSFKKDFFYYVP